MNRTPTGEEGVGVTLRAHGLAGVVEGGTVRVERVSPRGMQLISTQRMEEFQVYAMEMRRGEERLRCRGVVVDSSREGASYRSVIHFLGVDAESAVCLERFAEWGGGRVATAGGRGDGGTINDER